MFRKFSSRISRNEIKKGKGILIFGLPAVLLIGTLSGLISAWVADVTTSFGLKIAAPTAVILFSILWILGGFLITKD